VKEIARSSEGGGGRRRLRRGRRQAAWKIDEMLKATEAVLAKMLS
jgi:hypothetical protein